MNKGFTLIEVIVSIAISTIVMVAVFSLYFISQKSYTAASLGAELTQNGRIIIDRISRELRQAEEIVTQLPLDDDNPNDPPKNELEFQDGHVPDPVQYIRYYKNNGELHREISHYYFPSDPNHWVKWNSLDNGGNAPLQTIDEDQIKAEYLEDLSFYGQNLIVINLKTAKNGQTYSLQTKIRGRNL